MDMALNVNTVMDGIGVRLATISGLRVFDFMPDSFSPPAAVVSLPDLVDYDASYQRGTDRIKFNVHVLVGKVSDRNARDRLGDYLAGTGGTSVKTAIEADKTLGGAAETTRVESATVSVMTVAGMDFLAATWVVDVVG